MTGPPWQVSRFGGPRRGRRLRRDHGPVGAGVHAGRRGVNVTGSAVTRPRVDSRSPWWRSPRVGPTQPPPRLSGHGPRSCPRSGVSFPGHEGNERYRCDQSTWDTDSPEPPLVNWVGPREPTAAPMSGRSTRMTGCSWTPQGAPAWIGSSRPWRRRRRGVADRPAGDGGEGVVVGRQGVGSGGRVRDGIGLDIGDAAAVHVAVASGSCSSRWANALIAWNGAAHGDHPSDGR